MQHADQKVVGRAGGWQEADGQFPGRARLREEGSGGHTDAGNALGERRHANRRAGGVGLGENGAAVLAERGGNHPAALHVGITGGALAADISSCLQRAVLLGPLI